MQERLQNRFEQLQQEYKACRSKLHELEVTLYRIEGAMLLCEELLSTEQRDEGRPATRSGGNGQQAAATDAPPPAA